MRFAPRAVPALLVAATVLASVTAARAHGPGDAITWNREISRLVLDKCASCHRPGGTSFSLLTFSDVQPRGTEIKDAVLSRRMPPWGAVKGFGRFRNDRSLSQEQNRACDQVGGRRHPAGQQTETCSPRFPTSNPKQR